jgi:hypothetical protein
MLHLPLTVSDVLRRLDMVCVPCGTATLSRQAERSEQAVAAVQAAAAAPLLAVLHRHIIALNTTVQALQKEAKAQMRAGRAVRLNQMTELKHDFSLDMSRAGTCTDLAGTGYTSSDEGGDSPEPRPKARAMSHTRNTSRSMLGDTGSALGEVQRGDLLRRAYALLYLWSSSLHAARASR